MDLKQLQALVAVADHKTFSAAARSLHTVQSNVSAHVAHLEAELGVTLVDRARQQLTEEGHAVVARARLIGAELAHLANDLASITSEITGEVAMGSIGTTGRWLLPDLLRRLEIAHPGIRLVVSESVTTSLVPRLLTGQLDMAVLNLPLGEPELRVVPLFEEELVLVAPPDHRLAAGTGPISLRELAGEELLLGPPGTILREDIDAAAADVGVELRARAEVDGVRLIASLAFLGFAPTIVPATAIPSWVTTPNWASRPLRESLRRKVGLAIPRRGLPSAPADAVRTALLTVVRDVGALVPGIHLLD